MSDEREDLDPTRDPNAPRGERGEHDDTLTAAGRVPEPAGGLPLEIGGYRIVGKLGEGGMGVVYEAEQPSPRRRVALKVIRGHELVDDLALRMFAREAATLARLDHPNIGRIYESGRTPEGRHFFAMELVRGPSLAAWLAARPAPDRAELELRLRLFRQICEAVHYAHQRGVIHRDLKPSNLIVPDAPAGAGGSSATAASPVKILDFGLARITEGDLAATQVTEVGVIKGTLPYMAPEQARGDADAIDVRTDVYALGVILYELLTGQRPYTVDAGSLLSAVRVICEQAPRPLAEVWRGSARLDPDLETIAGTALAKEPERRYASAAALAEDVGRFLTSQPIQARPPSTMYQLRKLVARRKPLFVTAGAAVLLLIVAAAGMSVLWLRSVAAERAARREAATAERTSDFLVELFDRANPERTRGATVTAREVMDEGARSVSNELAGEPVMKARLMHTLGRVYLSLGLPEQARALVDSALALRRAHLPAGDADIAASLHERARVLEEQGEYGPSVAEFREAIALYEKLGANGADGLTAALGNLGWLLGQRGEFAAADSALGRAMALAEARRPRDEERVLKLLNNLSTVTMDRGKPDSALALLDRALALSRRLHGDRDRTTADVLTNIGVANSMAGRPEPASRSAVEALGIYRAVYGEAHPQVAKALANVGIYYAEQQKFAEARPYFEASIAALTKIHGPNHPAVAQGCMNLGLLKLQSGDPRAALPDLQRAVSIHEGTGNGVSPSLSVSLYHLASARSALGENARARELLRRVLAMDEKIYGAESGEAADDLEAIAAVERELGNAAEADRLEARMKAIRERAGALAKK